MRKIIDIHLIEVDNVRFFENQLKDYLNKGYVPYDGRITGVKNMNYVTTLVLYEELKQKTKKEKKVMI